MTRRDRKGTDHSRSADVLNALERRALELNPGIDPWEQQPAETNRNYGLFQMYRDHGRIRSVAQVATMIDYTYPTVARIARYNKWVERAGRWDAEQDRITAIRLQGKREEMAIRHAQAANTLMKKALERLETLDINAISPHALILMMDTAARIERAALGLETMKGGAAAPAPTVTVTSTSSAADGGKAQMRVEVGVQHDRIMQTLDAMVGRMTPEQLAAGYEELTASAEEATRALDAALPATPPPQ